MSETYIANHAGMTDHAQAQRSFAQELQQLGEHAVNLVAGSQDYFNGTGHTAYLQVMDWIRQGVQNGVDVINRHGDGIDQAADTWVGADTAAAQGFAV